MNWGELGVQILAALSPVILAIASWLALAVKNYFESKTKNEVLKGMGIRLFDAFGVAIQSVGQTYVADLKAAAADGKLTAEEKAEAKRKAIEASKSYLGPKGLGELAKVLGVRVTDPSLESVLGLGLEATLGGVKRQGEQPVALVEALKGALGQAGPPPAPSTP